MAELQTGVWQHGTGPRIEISAQDDGWQFATFRSRSAERAGTTVVFDDDTAARKLGEVEAAGYRYEPFRPLGASNPLWPSLLVATVLIGGLAISVLAIWLG
nr:hypothetical protein [Micromonospora sp. DSM 115978]